MTDLEFWISGGRREGGGQTIVAAVHQMYLNVPRAKVVELNWQSWPQFLTTVGSMDLLLQPSYTEGFNMVTADGIAQGVASVVSDAIAWAPRNWQAATDDASDIANTRRLRCCTIPRPCRRASPRWRSTTPVWRCLRGKSFCSCFREKRNPMLSYFTTESQRKSLLVCSSRCLGVSVVKA